MTSPSEWALDEAPREPTAGLLSQQQLHEYRNAAELAWSDQTRHPLLAGDPQRSHGQCWVTSKWLTSLLGGDVARRGGHYFWVSPDRGHVVDLTGDQFAYPPEDLSREGLKLDEDDEVRFADHQLTWRSGPVVYVEADHPLYRGFEVVDQPEDAAARRFRADADEYLTGLRTGSIKVADLLGADPYPGEEPQARADYERSVAMEMPLHAEPGYEPETAEYSFVYGNGQLHVSPVHDHSELAGHAGIDDPDSHAGPFASGLITVVEGSANWQVDGNVGLRAFHRVLKDYTDQVGWRWGGLTSVDGEPVNDDFAPKKSMYYSWDVVTGHLLMSERVRSLPRPEREDPEDQVRVGRIVIQGSTATTDERDAEPLDILREWASDQGYKLAEVPGGGNMLDTVKRWETQEADDLGTPEPRQRNRPFFPRPPDERQPGGVFKCPKDGRIFPSFYLYRKHLEEEHPAQELRPEEDGGFPELDMDKALPPHFHETQPEVMPVASFKQAARVPGFGLYSKLWGFDNDEHRHYVAFLGGSPVGYATVLLGGLGKLGRGGDQGATLVLVQSALPGLGIGTALVHRLQDHHPSLVSRAVTPDGGRLLRRTGFVCVDGVNWRWARGVAPKDMIEAPVPFVYDIEQDHIVAGRPGEHVSDIPGTFSPSGIQEGTYEPGGKIVLRNITNMPVTVRHLLDLWAWSYPEFEVKSVEQQDDAGRHKKLAERDDATIGRYVTLLARATDPAASRAIDALAQAGGRPYIVGGAVRDAFLEEIPKDFDLVVTGLAPEQVEQTLAALPGEVNLTGKKFGVYRYREGAHEAEVALPRTDTSTGDRKRDFDAQVDPSLPIEDDLLRRDFTVNSVAVDALSGKIVDPYGGIQDVKDGKLRTTHPNSFREDPTRVLRALTAHAKHGFEPDERTRKEMREHASQIPKESQELVQAELDKTFAAKDPASAVELAHDTGVLGWVFPEIEENWSKGQNNPHHDLPLGPHYVAVLRNAQRLSDDPDFRLAALWHDVGKEHTRSTDPETGHDHFIDHERVGAELFNNRLGQLPGYSNDRRQRMVGLVQHHMWPSFETPQGARRFLNRVGDHADDLFVLREADFSGKRGDVDPADVAALRRSRELVEQVRQQEQAFDRSGLEVDGRDLINMGLQPGPQFATILETLTNEVIEDPTKNERSYLLQRARELA